MDRRTFFGGAALASLGATGLATKGLARTGSLRDRLLGAWQIVDAETIDVRTGASGPWFGRPRPYSGLIIYLPDGTVAAQIGAARPPIRADAGIDNLSRDEKLAMLDTYYAYHGRYEIDEPAAKVRHFVEHSLFEPETGATLVRSIALSGDLLTLTTDPYPGANGARFNRLQWRRLWAMSE